MMPVAAYNLLQSIDLLAASARNFATQCVDGITATENGPGDGRARADARHRRWRRAIGYDAAAAIAKEAYASGRTVREVARERTDLSEEELTALLDPEAMTHPGRDAGRGRRQNAGPVRRISAGPVADACREAAMIGIN